MDICSVLSLDAQDQDGDFARARLKPDDGERANVLINDTRQPEPSNSTHLARTALLICVAQRERVHVEIRSTQHTLV